MLTTLNTYEGVPIGGNNFEDLFSYFRTFIGANFSFSVQALSNNGGYFANDVAFGYTLKGSGGNEANFFSPTVAEVGSLFGRYNNEYYKFDVYNAATSEPQVHEWTLLPENIDNIGTTSFLFENTSVTARKLPYRPVAGSGNTYTYGYHDIRFNGSPQGTNYTLAYPSPQSLSGAFNTQSLTISKITMGAEYPRPVLNERYDSTGLTESYTWGSATSTDLTNPATYNSRLAFPHTNFSIDFGGHIILYRPSRSLYVYVPQDTSSGSSVASGTYKVVDYSRGIIELNLTSTQLNQLIDPSESFTAATVPFNVISAEQLQEEHVSGATNYYSKYGTLYDGDDTSVLLVEYLFDGQNHTIIEIPSSNYISTSGDLLFQDATQQYSDGIILAIKYNGIPNLKALDAAQTTRYEPDVFSLFYSVGLLNSTASTSSIRAIVEQNDDSWYNRDVLNADYYPVNRTISTYYSFVTTPEVANGLSSLTSFNPDFGFKIVDTIGLKSLNDVPTTWTNHDTIAYNSTTTNFDAVPLTLAGLFDTVIAGPSVNQIIAFDGTNWVNTAITGTPGLGYTPVNKAGDSGLGKLSYSVSVVSGDSQYTLVNKSYSEDFSNNAVATHNAQTNVHGATSAPTASRIIIRDSSGQAKVNSPNQSSGAYNSTYASFIANQEWVYKYVNNQPAGGITTGFTTTHRSPNYDVGVFTGSSFTTSSGSYNVLTDTYSIRTQIVEERWWTEITPYGNSNYGYTNHLLLRYQWAAYPPNGWIHVLYTRYFDHYAKFIGHAGVPISTGWQHAIDAAKVSLSGQQVNTQDAYLYFWNNSVVQAGYVWLHFVGA